MIKILLTDIDVGDIVYYVPRHLDVKVENSEKGFVTSIKDEKVWVKFNGPTGELTPVDSLYK